MASIRKIKNQDGSARWKCEVYVKGKRKAKSFSTRREALEWSRKTEDLLQCSNPSNATFRDVLERYRDNVSTKKKTSEWEIRKINYLIRTYSDFFNLKISDISRADVSSWRDERLEDSSAATTIRDWAVISNAFQMAVQDWGLASENPFKQVSQPKKTPPRERIITDREIELFLHAADYSKEVKPKLMSQIVACTFLFALETAMRAQEISNLRWEDINGRVAQVTTSKTRSGIRQVPLSNRALDILEQMNGVDTDKVFPISSDQISTNFIRIKRLIGKPDFTFHDARATAITRLAKKLEILDLARMVGHKDLSMLMVYYRESADSIANKLD